MNEGRKDTSHLMNGIKWDCIHMLGKRKTSWRFKLRSLGWDAY